MSRSTPAGPGFSPATTAWLAGAFAAPTAAQSAAWRAIAGGEHTLVVAPTGSGKTLAAFLWALDRLARAPRPGDPLRRCRVLYVSPLKALAVDIDRNLRAPLTGIRRAAARLGLPVPEITVAMRSGDTPAAERRAFARRPPDILITTPESLFLLLTSAARESLRGVETVIVDEIHAICPTKRGAHLALSLERLDARLTRPAQRIGLSATVRPTDEVAVFLAGGRPVTTVQPPVEKTIDLSVVVPVEDMSKPGDSVGAGADPRDRSSIWPHVEQRVLDLIGAHRSTIVFVNSRRLAERMTSRLNELASERAGIAREPDRSPAEAIGQSGAAFPSEDVIVARAHHGSVSREQRALVEQELKSGRLPAVVATSSLELGIDMGAVDLVIQISSPPSVAAGLQRVGRAGHQVGAPSKGVILPRFRGELLECAVVAERIRTGEIESMSHPRSPLDVLAQQIVAMVAMDDWTVDGIAELCGRAAPFADVPRSVLSATLDMLAGRYPSDAFAELRPRLNWNRVTGELTARPGAQRLAVTSGGTIPDRGLFGVFLAGDGAGRRVGELDEEMVYESRVGDVFLLGSSSWLVQEITHDRVLVTPAPGRPGRMPFWKGDSPGRPVELGRAVGAFTRQLAAAQPEAAAARARAAGLDDHAAANLVAYLAEQRAATGRLPDDRTVVVERFRDELGDWRLVVHSPFGVPVNAPWALAIRARLRERYGLDAATMHSDDGIVVRVPDTDAAPPGAELVAFDPDEIAALVAAAVSDSTLFAARFRECAARALLLPRHHPGGRSPLWQQRQRAGQLLAVAAGYGEFPIVLEAMRECLRDVFDLPGLTELMREIAMSSIAVVEAETATASPFARALLFDYVGAFIYDGDTPLAERRAQALSLDSALLADLLGATELRELLDPDALAEVTAEVGRLAPSRHARGVDGAHDLLRGIGDLTTGEALARGAASHDLAELAETGRAIRVRIGGDERWLAIEDAGRVRDALGVALPVGVPEPFTEPVRDPLGDLVARHARTHGPFVAADIAHRLGLGTAVVTDTLDRLAASGRVVRGAFSPGGAGPEWCGVEVLRAIRRRSLAALRREIEPVPPRALARFVPAWQGVGAHSSRGVDGLSRAVEQLAGVPIPAAALETLVLPARIVDYSPAMLDELTLAGEVVWTGTGQLGPGAGRPGAGGWVVLATAELAPLLFCAAQESFGPVATSILAALGGGNAMFYRSLAERANLDAGEPVEDETVTGAIWTLVAAGLLTNDTLAPVRALLRPDARRGARLGRAPASRRRYGRYADLPAIGTSGRSLVPVPYGMGGRWAATPPAERDPTRRALAAADALLDRYGVVSRGSVVTEPVPGGGTAGGAAGGFTPVYRVLRAAEESGRVRRGYFVAGLGGAQFALPGAVERLRAEARTPEQGRSPSPALVLAAADPANPYGAALAWPTPMAMPAIVPGNPPARAGEGVVDDLERAGGDRDHTPSRQRGRGHHPARRTGALVVLVDGGCALYVERGGRSVLSFTDDPAVLQPAADALALAVRGGALGSLAVERADGAPVATSPLGAALAAAGFRPTPHGLRLRG